MFLQRLIEENDALIAFASKAHQEGLIEPDTYVIDVDTVVDNGKKMMAVAKTLDIEMLVMTKQFGRNPYLAKKLVELGFTGVVAVDYRDAKAMMNAQIPLAHVGHLVQIPQCKLEEVLIYGVDYITVYSIEKAKQINDICQQQGKVQKVLIKVYQDGDFLYEGQEAGFRLEALQQVVGQLMALSHLEIAGATAFPCFLYDSHIGEVEPTPNSTTLKVATTLLEGLLQRKMVVNMPSCTQKLTLPLIKKLGGTQGEPGSSLIGMTPNKGEEKVAMVYVSETSHKYQEQTFCYGGGFYRRGKIVEALIKDDKGQWEKVKVRKLDSESIDYHFKLQGQYAIAQTVMMCFRTQIFVTRSKVVLVEGLKENCPKIVGVYDSQGRRE